MMIECLASFIDSSKNNVTDELVFLQTDSYDASDQVQSFENF